MRRPEIPALTGVRFYFAFLVLCAHVSDIPGLLWLRDYRFFLLSGRMGVAMFFVLSGFILTYNYAEAFADTVRPTNYGKFIWDRFSKIYPTHFVTLLISIPMQVYSPYLPLDWRAVPIHFGLLQCFMPFSDPPYTSYLNFPSWSISCEWFFYLLCPFAIWFFFGFKRAKAGVVATIVFLLVLVFCLKDVPTELDRSYFQFFFAPTRFLEFLGGVVVGSYFLKYGGPTKASSAMTMAAVAIGYIAVALYFIRDLPWYLQGGFIYMPGTALLIYSLSTGQGFLAQHLSGRVLNVLGMASFALYLFHFPVARLIRALMRHYQVADHPSWQLLVGATVAFVVISQAVAILSLYYWELPMQKWMRKLVKGAPRQYPAPKSVLGSGVAPS